MTRKQFVRSESVEVMAVVELVRQQRAVLVNVGHGRDPDSVSNASAFVETWQSMGGEVGAVVSWPAVAASWLRPACRFAAGAPDAWVVADEVAGWTGFAPRLVATGLWRSARTVAFGSLADPGLPELVGFEATDGLRGARPDGSAWTFRDGVLISDRAGGR
ncbi:hypothetical protein F0L68_20845 [Solihabitans fulvus]|uniref:Uncharacterized protein n=1 Tax=Solihabitans fulvus TaxID=1892852 RepID=A0A5B2X7F9_9PSEU|nr:hypothetical protein [Solihabitans fulvus]KAA2259397.1 hypothetical protein F0L68_20845 [Solihabitans fulvus]